MIIIPIYEPAMSVDEFNNPKVFKNAEAVMVQLTRLILLNPGTIQSHPNMGVGLVQRYRYSMEGNEVYLKSDIINQINTYLPNYQGADVKVVFKDHVCYISITIDSTIFMIMYDETASDSDAIQTRYTKLGEL